MTRPPQPRCPQCGEPVGRLPQNRAFPFCSPRCKRVDLGRWLGEEYAIPVARSDGDYAEGGALPDPGDDDWR